MPSQRRMRVFGLLVVLTVVITLYMTRSARQTRNSDFYLRTQEALQSREYQEAAKQRDEADVHSRLKAAEEAAKKSADEKGQKFFDSVGSGGSGVEKPIGGRYLMKEQDGDEKKVVQGVATVGGRPRDKVANKEPESDEDHEVEVELNAILKKSPIIIFSKTYCPHSKKAKHILLDKYRIVPAPYVVELDEHPLGLKLQEKLADSTGRKTVPNILILGRSIGGGDQIQELDETDKLIDTVKSMASARVIEAERRRIQSEMRRRRV
ncbi:glutaredoxin [Trematosphaeria pertusa]|uniref:Glutaredoxin n=1 Tax=Trematosphaeria pertusa TaxID=390896 RepID=A0A6A6IF92_9PLEO|nr:glutaredoxin [Trematosphaeria pertusa]KAF2248867.1 glutaredoxin [Trematosphaeria pertusa]